MSIRRYSPSQLALPWLSVVAAPLILAVPHGADFFAGLLGGKGKVCA
ncbi:cytochrome b, partial [Pseudomonas aeruginosa]